MPRWCLVAAVVALTSLCAIALPQQQVPLLPFHSEDGQRGKVFILSLDGFRHDYLERADELGLRVPNLRRLMQQGAWSHQVRSVYPSVTYPSHTTMITGVNPDRHMVLANAQFDPKREQRGLSVFYDEIKVTTLFDAVHAAGLNTSAIEWPVTAFSPSIDWNKPDIPTSSSPVQQQLVFHGCLRGDIVRQSIPSVDALKRFGDRDRADLAIRIIKESSAEHYPSLQALHLIDFDHAQHVSGTFTQQALQQLEQEDQYIGEVLDALHQRGTLGETYFMLVADHGFTNITQFVAPAVLLASQDLLLAGDEWVVATHAAPGIYAVYIRPTLSESAKRQAEDKVRNIVNYLVAGPEFGIERAFVGHQRVQAAKLTGFPGAFAIMESRVGVVFTDSTTGSLISMGPGATYKATHGFNPDNADMKTNFIINGPGIKQNFDIGAMSLTQIAPTIGQILNLEMHQMDGQALNLIFEDQ